MSVPSATELAAMVAVMLIAAEPSKFAVPVTSPEISIARVVASAVAVVALPAKAAVTVPAAKLPEASRATIVLLPAVAVAVVAELETLPAVEIVASLLSTIGGIR